MARLRAPVRGALLLFVALAIALGAAVPALAAEPRDPRCDAWEAGAPPPRDQHGGHVPARRTVTTRRWTSRRSRSSRTSIGLVVMALVLGTFGVVAMRVMAPETRAAAVASRGLVGMPVVRGAEPRRIERTASRARDPATPSPSRRTAAEDPHPA